MLRSKRSYSDSFDSKDLFSTLMTLLVEKTLSTFPFDAGKENKSSARVKAFSQSDLLGL